MIVHIVRDQGFVAAMGHRVALHLGGEPELKRRVLGTLGQLDDPPDEVRFERLGTEDAGEADDADPEELPAPPESPAEAPPGGEAPPPRRVAGKGKPPPRRRR